MNSAYMLLLKNNHTMVVQLLLPDVAVKSNFSILEVHYDGIL